MNSEQELSYPYGCVISVSASKGVCLLQTQQSTIEVNIPAGKVPQVLPSVGEFWSYYRNGTARVLHDRVAPASEDERYLQPGDVLIDVKGMLHVDAEIIDMKDSFGEFINPITHLLNRDRQNGTPVYAVSDESDVKSLDGQDITYPCILAIVNGTDIAFKYHGE